MNNTLAIRLALPTSLVEFRPYLSVGFFVPFNPQGSDRTVGAVYQWVYFPHDY